jgi:hypothetical protein
MKKIFLLFSIFASGAIFCQEQPVITQEQQQLFNVLIGINRTCIERIAGAPQITINRVVDAVKNATENDLLKPLFHIYRLSINSLVHDEDSVAITEDSDFLPHDLWVTLIKEGYMRDLWTADGIASAQVRDIFLACYSPFGLTQCALVDLIDLNESENTYT